MANHIKSTIKVQTNIQTPFYGFTDISLIEIINKLYSTDFKDEDELTKSWMLDNIGSKFIELNDVYTDEISFITSHVPKELLIKIFDFFNNKDGSSKLEVDYIEECYQQVGSVIIKEVGGEIRYATMETDKINIDEYDLTNMEDVDKLEFDVMNYTTCFKEELWWMIEDEDCEVIEKTNG